MVPLCALLAYGPALALAQTPIFDEPLSPRIANYDIKATLDDDAKRITGDMVLTWNNPSYDQVPDLQFHLYLNAFKSAKSTMSRERLYARASTREPKRPEELPWSEDKTWGWIRITRMEVDGVDVTDRIKFHHPDDENTDDQTVAKVDLPRPIAPRATATIHVQFDARSPENSMRTGWWQDDFFMVSQWFPKIGVYEPPGMRFVPNDAPWGRWNCHQFHLSTEFYADFGVYDVQLTLPEKYVVGSTGLIRKRQNNDDGTQTVFAHAEDVHDFACVADARFREATGVWQSATTGQVVDIRLLYQPAHQGVVHKYLESVKGALDHVDAWLDPMAYPYPNLTIVDPRSGSGAGGMEYPTLITGGALWWLDKLAGTGARPTEMVTIHEFMHQFWYGIVASNEFEEAWLDEGFTQYSENRISDDLYGPTNGMIDFMGITLGSSQASRVAYITSERMNDGSLATPTFTHWRHSVGFGLSYNKTSLILATLENHLGRERFDRIMRTYFQRFKFRHPCRDDFRAVANEVAGENLDWFFDQVIDEATSLDYGVASIANVPLEAYEDGCLGDDYCEHEDDREDQADADDAQDDDEDEEDEDDQCEPHHSTVVFRRIGEIVFPMETMVEFSDGEIVRDTWDGIARVKVYHFDRPAKVIRASIDPDRLVPLDVNRLNNSFRIERNDFVTNKFAMKGFFWMQSLLQFFSIFG
jgi:hypothetical protein